VTALWAAQLQAWGHEVTVITNTPDPGQQSFPFPVLRRASGYRQWQAMRRADVVVQFDISLKGLPLWWLSGKPLVISHHTGLFPPAGEKPWRQRLKQWCCHEFPVVNITCSHFLAKDLKRTAVVHSPYDSQCFHEQEKTDREPGSVLFVGRMVSVKGLSWLLASFGDLWQRQPSARLTVAGSGPEESTLRQWVQQQPWRDAIEWKGALAPGQVAMEMNRHQLLVVPSLQEPFGTVVLEGLACGCKVITSNAGGLPEAGGEFTTVVPVNDQSALAVAMSEALQHGSEKEMENNQVAGFLQQHTVAATAGLFLETIKKAFDN
jgi:glycosyltransferase involved in cell wall biosynthesis